MMINMILVDFCGCWDPTTHINNPFFPFFRVGIINVSIDMVELGVWDRFSWSIVLVWTSYV